jgi:hypothetical protein
MQSTFWLFCLLNWPKQMLIKYSNNYLITF